MLARTPTCIVQKCSDYRPRDVVLSYLSCKKGHPQEGQNLYVRVNMLTTPETAPHLGHNGRMGPMPSLTDSL